MKTETLKTKPDELLKKKRAAFASEAEFVAAERKRFQEVFGNVDWEKARKDGLV